jgi:hypothetical protein
MEGLKCDGIVLKNNLTPEKEFIRRIEVANLYRLKNKGLMVA